MKQDKGRTIRKVMGGGGGRCGKTKQNKFMQGKMPRKNIRAKEKVEKKFHAEGKSNCDFYLKYEICQRPLKIILMQNILGALPQALLYYY